MYVRGKKKAAAELAREQKRTVGRGRNIKGKVGWSTEERRL